jgi:hypothetical protein
MKGYVDIAVSQAIKDNGVYFAYDEKQVKEGAKEGVKYVHIGGGALCPKENVEKFINESYEGSRAAALKEIEEKGADKIIRYEYFNHECQISDDFTSMKDALTIFVDVAPEKFSPENIARVASDCFQYAIDNDCF